MPLIANTAIVLGTVIGMEAVAWAAHKYIMHGWGWGWHQSHHRKHDNLLERNDLYAAISAAAAILLFAVAPNRAHWLFWLAIGITAYGLLYAVLHDGLVHRRYPLPGAPRNPYLQRLIRAHHLHHATPDRLGAVSFGFLYAPPVRTLVQQMRRLRATPP